MADYQQNFMNALQGGLQFGQQIKGIQDQRQLNELASQGYGAPREQRTSLLGQLASINPQAAAAQRKQWSADDEMDQEELVNMARFIKSAPPEQQAAAYSSILPKLRERGMQAPEWTPETQQTILQTVDALVNAYGGQDDKASGVQSTYVDNEGNRVAVMRDGTRQILGKNAPATQILEGEGGFYGVNKNTEDLRATPVGLGGSTANPITGTNFGIAETNDYVQSILSKAGNIDPNAPPEQQAEALLPFLIQQESSGDPNAVSPKGARGLTQVMPATGQDPGFGVQPLRDNTPQENVRFGRDYLTAMLRRYPGRVDLALAAYNAGPGVADRFASPTAQAGPQQLRPAPKAQAQSELDRRIEIARGMGATPDQLRNIALGSAAPDAAKQATAAEVKEATARRMKRPQLLNLERGLGNIEEALGDIESLPLLSTGPATGRLISQTPQGQKLDTAVGAIQESLLSLTRVPGIGAQSDLEARIANLKYPQTGNYAQNNQMLLDNLRAIIRDIGDAYRSMEADDDAIIQSRSRQPQRVDDVQADDIDSLLELYP